MFSRKPKEQPPATEAEKYRQALVTANVAINDNRAKMRLPLENYQKVANSTYWSYGYIGGTMISTMAVCLVAGNRIPFFRSYASWISLASGYFGGKALHGLHNSYNVRSVVAVIDKNIEELLAMDEKLNGTIPDYKREVNSLRKMKFDLQPDTPEAKEAVEKSSLQSAMSIDDRANALVAAFERKRKL